MKPLVPAPRGEWTEASGRAYVDRRAEAGTGIRTCEVSSGTWGLEWSHRTAEGRGGTYAPSNGILLARPVHAWAHANPVEAYRLGWHVRTGYVPAEVPVWLARPWPGFWHLRDDDGPLKPAHPEDHPDLPDDTELARLLPPAARGAFQ